MLHKFREQIKRWLFNNRCRTILSTRPIQINDGRLTIVSMVSHLDLKMYLFAIKSLYFSIGYGEIVIINDGTLTSSDIKLLKYHITPIKLILVDNIENGNCPRGGTWERLALISDYVKQNYVIQLDSDTLTIGDIAEVTNSIKENRPFILGTGMGRQIVPMPAKCEQMKHFDDGHIQVVAEQNFDQLRNYTELKYVRGCSGFAGFARGSFSLGQVEEFSQEMQRIIGKAWLNWGSEQVTSNYILANCSNAWVLPYPKYANFSPEIPYEQSAFLHFIGTYRFRNGTYVRQAKRVGTMLQKAKS